jgi:4-hydroxybenzoate polyprenyltransferase
MFAINDMYDYASDLLNPRKNSFQGAVQHPDPKIAVLAYAMGALCVLTSALFGTLVQMSALLLIVYIYSAPPRTKTIPILDIITNSLAVYAVFWMGASFAQSAIPQNTILLVSGFAAIQLMASIVDYQSDKLAGELTSAVFFGPRLCAAIAFCIICYGTLTNTISIPYTQVAGYAGIIAAATAVVQPKLTRNMLYLFTAVCSIIMLIFIIQI